MLTTDGTAEEAGRRLRSRMAQERWDESPEGQAEAKRFTDEMTARNEAAEVRRALPCEVFRFRVADADTTCDCSAVTPAEALVVTDLAGVERCLGCALAATKRWFADVEKVVDRYFPRSYPSAVNPALEAQRPVVLDLVQRQQQTWLYGDPRPVCSHCERHYTADPIPAGSFPHQDNGEPRCAWCSQGDRLKAEEAESKVSSGHSVWP